MNYKMVTRAILCSISLAFAAVAAFSNVDWWGWFLVVAVGFAWGEFI